MLHPKIVRLRDSNSLGLFPYVLFANLSLYRLRFPHRKSPVIVRLPRFELRLTESKSVVLPLHYRADGRWQRPSARNGKWEV